MMHTLPETPSQTSLYYTPTRPTYVFSCSLYKIITNIPYNIPYNSSNTNMAYNIMDIRIHLSSSKQ